METAQVFGFKFAESGFEPFLCDTNDALYTDYFIWAPLTNEVCDGLNGRVSQDAEICVAGATADLNLTGTVVNFIAACLCKKNTFS